MLTNPFHLGDRIESVFVPHGDLDSNAHREMCREIGYQMIEAHPWLGIGPEQVQYQYMNYLPPGTQLPLPTGDYGHLHNDYIHYAAELGIPTALAMLWMFGCGAPRLRARFLEIAARLRSTMGFARGGRDDHRRNGRGFLRKKPWR